MFVKTLNILLAEWLKVPTEGLAPMLERKLHERLVFTNPDYELRHNRGEWIGNIPPQISCIKQKGRTYLLPRGFLDQFTELCKKYQQPYRLVDRRRSFDPVPIEFHGQLKSYQQDAVEAVLEHDFGTLIGGHKSGKTVIALYSISQRRQPTLILIPKLDLLEGWLTKIENFLQIPRSEVGLYAGGVQRPGQYITIAHTGEMMRMWRKMVDQVGFLILDECQRCPSKVLTQLVPNFDARYMLGLTNTAQRKDRLSRLVYYYLGNVVYTINEKDAREGRGIIHAHVVARTTQFEYPYSSRADYTPMLEALMSDHERNRIIADDIQSELQQSQQPLVIVSGGQEHYTKLGAELAQRGIDVITIDPPAELVESSSEEDEESVPQMQLCRQQIPHDKPVAVLLTPQILARCVHELNSHVLFLAVPVYFPKALANAIRNLHQNGDGGESKLKIFDYVDRRVGLLDNYFRMRSYNYGVHPDVLLDTKPN